jgi:hypothetical protein
MGHTGRLQYKQATLRIGQGGAMVPIAAPSLDSPSITVTAANRNTATMWFKYFSGAATNNTLVWRREGVPLTAGQSFTFTGVPIGHLGYRNVSFASGNTMYLAANSTPQVAIFGYYVEA